MFSLSVHTTIFLTLCLLLLIILILKLFNYTVCVICSKLSCFLKKKNLFSFRKQSYIGKLKFAEFDTSSTVKKIFVATEENVLTALNIKSGLLLFAYVVIDSRKFKNISRKNND